MEGWGQKGQCEAGTEPGKEHRLSGHSTASLNIVFFFRVGIKSLRNGILCLDLDVY